jgi:hypothetical protein
MQIKTVLGAGGVAQAECLLSKREALNSNPSTAPPQKKVLASQNVFITMTTESVRNEK